ncbi:MAG TPA: methyltransferase domain-containing protein [Candidatus Thermoplasmatota archaeon]
MSWWLRSQDRRRLAVFAEETEAILRAVAPRAGERLLDVGGGTGALAERFGGGFGEVVVLEPNERKRRHGAAARPAVKFVGGNAERIPFPDGHFDCVTAVVSFHHFEDQGAALKEIRRVLRAGGRMIIFEFAKTQGPGRFLKFLLLHHGRARPALVDPQGLQGHARRAGFQRSSAIDVGSGYLLTALA